MSDTDLQKTIFLKASKEEVWAYLTQPEHLEKWFHRPQVPLEQGQPLEMFGTSSGEKLIWGEVLRADPHDYLEYSFTVKPMGDAVSIVKWTLTEVPGGTRLSLTHEGLPQGAEAYGLTLALDQGWDKHFLQMREALHGDG